MNLTPESDETFFEQLNRGHSLLQNLLHQESDDADQNALHYRPIDSRNAQVGPVRVAAARIGTPVRLWRTQIARAVNCYNQGQLLGKVGLALLVQCSTNGKIEAASYAAAFNMSNADHGVKLTIYRSKNDVLCTMELKPSNGFGTPFNFCLKEQFLYFNDSEESSWCVGFLNDTDEQQFLKELLAASVNVKVEQPQAMEFTPDDMLNASTETVALRESPENANNDESRTRNRSKLISRMSRVGQALPNLTRRNELNDQLSREAAGGTTPVRQVGSTSSESDMEVIITPTVRPRTMTSAQPTTVAVPPNAIVRDFRQYRNSNNNNNNNYSSNSNNNDNQHSRSDLFQLLSSEQRNENCEMRINLSKMDFKLDKVLDRLERLERNASQSATSNGRHSVEQASRELLLQSRDVSRLEKQLAELINENRRLKQQLDEQAHDMAAIQHNQETEVSNVFQKYENQLKDLLPDQNQMQLDNVIGRLIELANHAQEPCETCNHLNEQTHLSVDEIINVCQSHNAICREHEQLLISLSEKTINESHDDAHSFESQLRESVYLNTAQNIKNTMNRLYAVLADKLSSEPDALLGVIAKTIKEVTVECMPQREVSAKRGK